MMWHEFEKYAGYEVTQDDYEKYIEPMYMAVGDGVDKAEFAKMVNKDRFALPDPAKYLRQARKEARRLFGLCGHRSDYECEMRLYDAAHAYAERKYGDTYYLYFEKGYEYPDIDRGCTYPNVLVVCDRDGHVLEKTKLQRN